MATDYRKQSPATHNIKNAKYAVRTDAATPGTEIKDIPYAISISLSALWDKYTRYANGTKVIEIPSDQGRDGTFVTTAEDLNFEADLGYIDTGLNGGGSAEIRANGLKKIDFYYETDATTASGTKFVIKTWLLCCTVGKATKESTTDTENINPYDYSYPITVEGMKKLASDGKAVYRDENGNEVYVVMISKVPSDEGYDTFESAVPTPQEAAA